MIPRLRKGRLAATAAVAMVALSLMAGPAAASKGGCKESSTIQGYQMGVCLSDLDQPILTFPDVYVNKTPASTSGCRLYLELWEGGKWEGEVVTDPFSCAKGHYPLVAGDNGIAREPGCHKLHSHAYIRINGGPIIRIGDSPEIWYGWPGDTCPS
ncbi:hypothetical protein ACIBO2_33780 [Nonomuraea sp. NPDC050022]|uniref:hypothetical protein n=1 Tax=unclassified Nonomuraea TaxID=2593643 RepID=UPI0033F03BE1